MHTGPSEVAQLAYDRVAGEYDDLWTPQMVGPNARLTRELALRRGERVADLACGTGTITTEMGRLVYPGEVTGVDYSEGMLATARQRADDEGLSARWVHARAEEFIARSAADSFDVVLRQSALMFMPDPAGALREMARVVRASGTVAVQVWDRLEAQPAHAPLVAVAARHAGPEAIRLLSSYWVLGDRAQLLALFEAAGLEVADVVTRVELARFDSIDELESILAEWDRDIPFPEEANRMVRGHSHGPRPVRLPHGFLDHREGDRLGREAEQVVSGG